MAVSDCLDVGLQFRAGTLQPTLQPWPETQALDGCGVVSSFRRRWHHFWAAGILGLDSGFGVEKLPRTSQGR